MNKFIFSLLVGFSCVSVKGAEPVIHGNGGGTNSSSSGGSATNAIGNNNGFGTNTTLYAASSNTPALIVNRMMIAGLSNSIIIGTNSGGAGEGTDINIDAGKISSVLQAQQGGSSHIYFTSNGVQNATVSAQYNHAGSPANFEFGFLSDGDIHIKPDYNGARPNTYMQILNSAGAGPTATIIGGGHGANATNSGMLVFDVDNVGKTSVMNPSIWAGTNSASSSYLYFDNPQPLWSGTSFTGGRHQAIIDTNSFNISSPGGLVVSNNAFVSGFMGIGAPATAGFELRITAESGGNADIGFVSASGNKNATITLQDTLMQLNSDVDFYLIPGGAGLTFNDTFSSNFLSSIVTFNSSFRSTTNSAVASTSITFPLSNVNFTNPVPYNIVMYIDNSAVTGTLVKKNGQQIFSTLVGDVTLLMKPGDYFSETYTVGTPSARWEPQ